MKKLFVLFAFLLMVSSVFAQYENETLFVWFGGDFDGGWNNVITVSPDKDVDIDVFAMQSSSLITLGDFTAPLGINKTYVPTFGTAHQKFYPLDLWDVSEFGNENDEFQAGWNSLSYLGIARISSNAPWAFWPDVTQILTFQVHTVAGEDYIDQTICDAIGPGYDPVVGPIVCGDTLGSGLPIPIDDQYACFYFSPNQPPVPGELALPYECGYTDFSVFFEVYDVDGDPVTVDANIGTWTLYETIPDELPDEGVTYVFKGDFDMEDFCGQCFSGDLEVVVSDGVNDPIFMDPIPITIVGQIVASMDPALYIWPGFSEDMPVYLDVCGDCMCVGGFAFTVRYDASVLTVGDVTLGDAFAGGEYFEVQTDLDPEGGLFRVLWINDLNNQTPVDDVCGLFEDPIFWFNIALAPLEYPADFCIDVCFEGDGYFYNNVSDPSGYHVWIENGCDDAPDSTMFGTMDLVLECGNVKVMNEHNLLFGDLNWNGFPYEVGDLVLLANHIMDADAYPFNLRQMFASDVNHDGFQASIADLIWMINYINGFNGGKVAPLDVIATVSMPVDASGDVSVMVNSEAGVGGAVVAINHAGVELGAPVAEGWNVDYTDNGDVMNVVVYNMNGDYHSAGNNVLFTLPVIGEGEITFGDVQVSNDRGALLDARSELAAPLPTVFAVNQNFPNPFNAQTRISFALPTNADVMINIYNVAGQLVESMDQGNLNAGTHSVVWDASDVASGVYFYKVNAGSNSETKKMTLLK